MNSRSGARYSRILQEKFFCSCNTTEDAEAALLRQYKEKQSLKIKLEKTQKVVEDLQFQLTNALESCIQAFEEQIKNVKDQVEKMNFEATQHVKEDFDRRALSMPVSAPTPL